MRSKHRLLSSQNIVVLIFYLVISDMPALGQQAFNRGKLNLCFDMYIQTGLVCCSSKYTIFGKADQGDWFECYAHHGDLDPWSKTLWLYWGVQLAT